MPAWDAEANLYNGDDVNKKDDVPTTPESDASSQFQDFLLFLQQLVHVDEQHLQVARGVWQRVEEIYSEYRQKVEEICQAQLPGSGWVSKACSLPTLCLTFLIVLAVCLWPFSDKEEVIDHADFTFSIESADLPYYDIVALIYATASESDVDRMREASSSWLKWNSSSTSFTFAFAICADDPGVWRVFGQPHVALIPCVHGYSSLVTKGIEGYRYLSSHFRYRYVLKADIDTVVPMDCIEQGLMSIDSNNCPSFGMGRWYPARSSKVWQYNDQPYGPKFHNEAYASDTGAEFYLPYMSGWAIIWSADVAQMLGMFGHKGPKWRSTWTIDDAAIGTFIIGLDICRLHLPCDTPTDVKAQDFSQRSKALDSKVEEPTTSPEMTLKGFDGPFNDDVPGPGDLANVQATSLGNCAGRCLGLPDCKSFEYSPTIGLQDPVRNCQLATGNTKSGVVYKDFKLYIRNSV